MTASLVGSMRFRGNSHLYAQSASQCGFSHGLGAYRGPVPFSCLRVRRFGNRAEPADLSDLLKLAQIIVPALFPFLTTMSRLSGVAARIARANMIEKLF